MMGPPGGGGGQPGETRCPHCGGVLTIQDLSMPACRYCGAVHAHVARAAEKVAVVHGLMGGMLAPPPNYGANAPILPGVVMPGGPAGPPMTGGPVAAGSPPGTMPHQPPMMMMMGGPSAWGDAHNNAMHAQKRIMKIVVIITVVSILFFTLIGLASFWLLWG